MMNAMDEHMDTIGEYVDGEGPQLDEDDVPPRILVAYNFVQLTNQFMLCQRQRLPGSDEIPPIELPAEQEGAFRLACKALGNFFAGKDEKRRSK